MDRLRLKRYKSDKQPRYTYMTKFEKARALGMRANQIANDSTKGCLVLIGDETDVQRLSKLELEENVLPIIVHRLNTNDEDEYWELDKDQGIYKDLNSTN